MFHMASTHLYIQVELYEPPVRTINKTFLDNEPLAKF
jgi:hypothetical protein